jgi:hypothetical protein
MALGVPAASSSGKAQEALIQLVQQYGTYYATSGVVNTVDGPIAVVAHSPSGADPTDIQVLAFRAGRWGERARFTSALSLAEATSGATPIVAARLTGATVPDFVVYTHGADFEGASVVSLATGTWRLIPFYQRGIGSDVIAPNVKVQTRYLTSVANNCKPTCASSASYTTTNYSYDSSAAAFVPLTSI